ncbi:Arf-GAP GTPase ANK repeat and PH domain-containing protein 1/2/3 [Clonorchis sinensis]|uniref:Arf-GAP GTPase ANK repeat and PH domain-containing protein 1/2/3 n=1 Tax=Clonorchis sinensis TaxID=79923 RepID=G7YVA2_CLOSI|nr:Arf-GAP GTPase ANK repeat and PH domain-containing protein 1/2/3 [Clonorchis sinensis]
MISFRQRNKAPTLNSSHPTPTIEDDKPPGGRFKKLCFNQTQPCLLLIRDEAGPPDVQLASWIDAFVFVVSLGDLDSVLLANSYYTILRGLVDLSSIPLILVATQDSVVNGTPPPEVEAGLRQLIATMDSCPYYETCAVYGLNVEEVFTDIMTRVLAERTAVSKVAPIGNVDAENSSIQPCSASTSVPLSTQSTANPVGSNQVAVRLPFQPTTFRTPLDTQAHFEPLRASGPSAHPESVNSVPSQIVYRSSQTVTLPAVTPPISHPISSPVSSMDPTSLHPLINSHALPAGVQVNMNPPALRMLQPYRELLPTVPSGSIFPSGNLHTSWIYQPPVFYDVNGVQHPQTTPLPDTAPLHSVRPPMSSASAHSLEPSLERTPPSVSSPNPNVSALNRRAASNLPQRLDMEAGPPNNSTSHPTQRLSDEHNKRDRPRPQSTGSLTGPLSGLASATLCTMGLHSSSSSTKQRDNLGAGRLIPLKQGYLYKHTVQRLSKEVKRKKKYVVITEDARLAYHPSKQDYINRQHCKWIDLTISTVKLPGLAYRMSNYATGTVAPSTDSTQSSPMNQCVTEMNSSFILPSNPNTSTTSSTPKGGNSLSSTPRTGFNSLMESTTSFFNCSTEQTDAPHTTTDSPHTPDVLQLNTVNKNSPNPSQTRVPAGRTLKEAMKRHYKRAKAAVSDSPSDTENQEFIVVTADSTQWHFEAPTQAERDDWIQHIDAVIHSRLRSSSSGVRDDSACETSNTSPLALAGSRTNGEQRLTPRVVNYGRPLSFTTGAAGFFKDGAGEEVCGQEEVLKRLTALPGNDSCADCGAAHPEWASLNLVVLICIECSGVHRELGTHISRVRSATLDTWTREHLAVMTSFGNTLANSVWEGAAPSQAKQFRKPEACSQRDVRAAWIQNKYVRRLFLPPLPLGSSPTQQDLVDALLRKDARNLLICLALSNSFSTRTASTEPSPVNTAYSAWDSRTPLHLAAALGDLASLQLLLWHGADVNSTDQFGLTAWTHAQICRQEACARLLQVLGCRCVPPVNTPADWLQRVQKPSEVCRSLLPNPATVASPNTQTESDTDSRSYTSSGDEDSSTTERHSGTAASQTPAHSK